jgi:hypothetical protein
MTAHPRAAPVLLALALAGCGASAGHPSTQATTGPLASNATTAATPPPPAAKTSPAAPVPSPPRTAARTATAATANRASATQPAQARTEGPVAIPPAGPTPPREPVKVPRAGDSSLQRFGAAATQTEFAAVAAAVRSYDLALAQGDGAAACELLGAGAAAQLATLYGRGKVSCAQVLSALAARYPPQFRASLRRVRVTDARLSGERGFAFFTMPTVPSGFFPVARQGGTWRVAALAGSSVP